MQEILKLFDVVPNLQLLCIGKEIQKVSNLLQEGVKPYGGQVDEHDLKEEISLDMVLPNRKYEACVLYNLNYNDSNFVRYF